ncbi:uncharacterized protein LOC135687133 isoform X5 [Rhopilema esculentum]|uniref:uncharacterized protein LOC135687133 isoform X5 n=1 Tax=Rhopilema esculentum TaxID=499914 RepID=UPI0031DE1797
MPRSQLHLKRKGKESLSITELDGNCSTSVENRNLPLQEKESSRQKSQVKPKTFGCSYATVVKGKKHIKNDMMSYKLPAVLECHGREDRIQNDYRDDSSSSETGSSAEVFVLFSS